MKLQSPEAHHRELCHASRTQKCLAIFTHSPRLPDANQTYRHALNTAYGRIVMCSRNNHGGGDSVYTILRQSVEVERSSQQFFRGIFQTNQAVRPPGMFTLGRSISHATVRRAAAFRRGEPDGHLRDERLGDKRTSPTRL